MAKRHIYKLVRETKTKVLNISTSLILVAMSLGGALPTFITSTAHAAGTVNIASESDLCNAIEHQADDEIWNIQAGTYALPVCNDIEAEGQTGWYFPITANNLTINGPGATIYGTGYTTNGAWHTQNFVTIFGDNVTLNGLTLMPKVEPNKTIEVLGSNATIKNVTIEPNTLTDQSEYDNIPNAQDRADERNWGGSIYYNNAGGTQTLDNVTINNGGVSVHAPAATFNVTNVNLSYTSGVDWINDYGFYVATPTTVINGTPATTWHVNNTLNNLDSVMAGVDDSTLVGTKTVLLDSDITVPSQVTVSKRVTIDGQGHTVSVSGTGYRFLITGDGTTLQNINVVKTDKTGVQNIVGIQASDVTIDNVDFTGQYASGDGDVSRALEVSGNNFTVKNSTFKNLRQPAYVNSFTGTISNNHADGTKGWVIVQDSHVTFTGNTWGTNATDIAIIPQGSGANYYTCAVMAQIRADNNNPSIDNQVLTNCPPTLTVDTPSEGSLVSTKANGDKLVIKGSFTDDVKANYATFQLVHNGSSVAIGTLYGYGSVYNPAATYANADGSYTFNLPVPANLADGTYSLFYTGTDFQGGVTTRMERTFTIDNTAPAAPTITHPTARQWFKTTPIVDSWTAVTDANGIAKYQIAYHYDDGHTFGSSTCPGLTISGVSGFIGCRDATGTSRNHIPSADEEGGVTIWVRAIDTAGNASAWSQSVHYYYDHSAPTGDISFPADGQLVGLANENGKLVVHGTVNDNLSMNRVGVQLVKPGISGQIQYLYDHMVNQNPGTWEVTFDTKALNLADGTYGINVYFVDMAGNVTTKHITFQVDNTYPSFAINNPANNATVAGTVTINAEVTDANDITKLLMNVGGHSYSWANGSSATITRTGDIFSLTVDTTTLPDGPVYVVLRATDGAGNVRYWNNNASNRQHVFYVDNSGPVVTDDFTVNLLTNENKTLQPTVTDASSPLTYLWSVSDQKLLQGNPSQPLNGTSLEIGSAPKGDYTVTLTVTDPAGNATTKTYNVTISTPANTDSLVGGRGGGAPNTFAAGTPQALGAETTTPSDTTSTDTGTDGTDGQVKGDNVVKTENAASTNAKSSNFLGLGWWWLLILAVLAGFIWFVAGRRSEQD